jgi:hypothetical protein
VPEDLRHARAILAALSGASPVRLGFGGHPAIRTLRAAGGMRVVQERAGRRGARPGRSGASGGTGGVPGMVAAAAAKARRRPALAALARGAMGLPRARATG